ncbi:MAG: hypothetical protein ABIH11_03925 [Candidatus Altiarchaeota archaeon]
MYLGATTDPNVCMPLFFIAFIVAILFSIGILQHNKFTYCLMEASRALGLKYIDGGFFYDPKLKGEYKGVKVSVYTFTKHRGDNKAKYTRVEALHKSDLRGQISISKDDIFTTVGDKLGVHEIHIMGTVFDNEYHIKGSNEDEVLRILDRELQDRIMKYGLALDITEDKVIHEHKGYIVDKKHLHDAIELVVETVERINKK